MVVSLSLLMRRRLPPIPISPSASRWQSSAAFAPKLPENAWPVDAPHPPQSSLLRQRARARIAAREIASPTPISPHLIDTFHRKHTYLRISLTERCNLRCTYCMPAEGAPLTPKEHLMTTPELLRIAEVMVRSGVKKIRLTGGEPTLRRDVVDVVQKLGDMRKWGLQSVGMTSNGIALKRKLPSLVEAGLTGLNLSLDTLDPFKFELITRRRGHEAVMQTLETALRWIRPKGSERSGLDGVKLNAVVVRGVNDMEIMDFVELTRDKDLEVRFIEYMPFEDNRWATRKLVPMSEMLDTIRSRHPDLQPVQTDRHDTTKHYQIPGYRGRVGFISSMTEHFCGGCTRLRLGADGRLKTCLFGPPTLDILSHLRRPEGLGDTDLMRLIGGAVQEKKAQHGGHEVEHQRQSSTGARGSANRVVAARQRRATSSLLPLLARISLQQPITRLFSTSTIMQKAELDVSDLSHIDPRTGKASMVDVSSKSVAARAARARGRVVIPSSVHRLLSAAKRPNEEISVEAKKALSKGDVFTVAQLAGIQAAKKTGDLIPLCHPLQLSHVDVRVTLGPSLGEEGEEAIEVEGEVKCVGRTGVEMEALTAVSVACLTVFDMLKAVCGREMRVEGVRVVEKTGGRADWKREY